MLVAILNIFLGFHLGRDSVPVMATGYGYRIPASAEFSTSAQTDPGAHPASYTRSTGSFSGLKRPRRGVDHPFPSRSEVKERVELYSALPLCLPRHSALQISLPRPSVHFFTASTCHMWARIARSVQSLTMD